MDDAEEPSREIRIPADSLEYTREGLVTESISLTVGRHNRVVIVRPPRMTALGQGARGFPNDSAYPLVNTLSVFWSLADVGSPFTHHDQATPQSGGTAYQVFGHTSASGDESHNKGLSDRRATVGLSLLQSDPQRLLSAAEEDGWGAREYQAMLRTLACDPGPIDDKLAERTEAAIALFAARYNDGVYHYRHRESPAAALEVDGKLTPATKEALFEAFVFAHGAAVDEAGIHPTHPANGCSEFNVADPEKTGAHNRRLAVIAHPSLPVHHANAPCTVGDDGACAVVDDAPMRCMYYRNHVVERRPAPVVFVDPRWMWLGGDRYLLSALTNIDGAADVEFEVYEADERVRGPAQVSAPWVEAPRSSVLKGAVWRGVAQVVWQSGETPSTEDGRPVFEKFPVFRVSDPATGAFTFAPWPEVQTLRVLVGSVGSTSTQERPVRYRLRAGDGSYDEDVALADAKFASSHHVAVEFEDVPLDARLTLSVGWDGHWAFNVFENVTASALPGNCNSGSQCKELPVPVAPPAPEVPDDFDDDEGNVIPWLGGDDTLFEEPVWV